MTKRYIFLHIPKTAGRTLETVLHRNFHQCNQFNLNDWNSVQAKVDELNQLPVVEKEKLRLVRGHYPFGIHEILPGDVKYFTFVRHPVDRVISLYKYISRNPQHHLFSLIKDKDYTIEDFIKDNVTDEFNNAQTRMIAGKSDKESLENENQLLKRAIENIENYFCFVGCVELFDISLLLLAQTIKLKFVFYESKNISSTVYSFSDSTIKTIQKYNQLDIELWTNIQQKLQNNYEQSDYGFKRDMKLLSTKNVCYSNILTYARKIREPWKRI